ncbi:MAG: hypothetical protein KDA59_16505, partial [Planctomycetales bacterium]|nr:hypothetical protein [Planctomycetales bacterium]
QITPRTRPQISSFVIETVEAAGIRVPPSSRLRRMHDLYHSGIGTIEPNHPDYETALEGERDMQLLAFAFDQLAHVGPSDAYRDRLKLLVSDSVLPQDDRANSPGRDAAFEIYVGAVCTAARLLPVGWEEPDVSCVLDDAKYGFAAKRLKNLRQLSKRVRDAVDQIDRCDLPGIIVLDLASAFNPTNRRIRRMHDSVFWSEYEANFNVTWSEQQPKVQKVMARANVLGVIVHDYHIRQVTDGWQLAGMTIRVPSTAQSQAVQSEFKRLSTLYTYGLPNQSDASIRPLILP